jgi:hypothetical protein
MQGAANVEPLDHDHQDDGERCRQQDTGKAERQAAGDQREKGAAPAEG